MERELQFVTSLCYNVTCEVIFMTISEIPTQIFFPIENKGYGEFSPVSFGAEKCLPEKSFGPFVRDHYLIHFIARGTGVFKNQNGKHRVDAGQAFLIRPEESCIYTADKNDPWVYIWVGFEGKLSEYFDVVDDVFEIDGEIIEELCKSLDVEYGREEYLTGILFKLYSRFFGKRLHRDRTKQVKDFIDANYMRDIKISDIAQMLHVDRKYLVRSFREKCGITIKQYLVEKRLGEAKKLLEKGKSVAESGIMVGYSDGFSFSKAFKQQYGISPLEHKKFYMEK